MLSIGSFSKMAQVTTKALRYYDEIGLLKPGYVDEGSGYRYYHVAQLEDVLLINKLKLYDLSLNQIAEVLKRPKDNDFILSLLTKQKIEMEIKLNHFHFVLKQLERDTENLKRGKTMMSHLDSIEVDLVETQPMHTISIRKHMNMADYANYMIELYHIIEESHLTPVGPPMSIFHGEEFSYENYDLEIAVPVKEGTQATKLFPGFLTAHVTLRGEYTKLPEVYSKLATFVEQERYTVAAPSFEIYLTNPHEVAPENNVTEIYLPIKK